MKKSKLLAFVLALVLALAPATVFADGEEAPKYDMDPEHLTFASEDDVNAVVTKVKETELTVADGEMKLTTSNVAEIPDPRVTISLENLSTTINAEDHPCVALVYKCPTTNTAQTNVVCQIYFSTKGADPSEERVYAVYLSVNDRYCVAIFNPVILPDWNGQITSIRLDYFYSFYNNADGSAAVTPNGDTMYVHDILFCADEASARRDAGNIAYALNMKDAEPGTYEMDPTHLVFSTQADYDAVVYRDDGKDPGKRSILYYDEADQAVRATANLGGTDASPYFYTSLGKLKTTINAEDYPYCAAVYKVPKTGALSSGQMNVYFNTKGVFPVDNSQMLSAATKFDGKYQYAVFNPGTLTDWSGVITSIRIDYFTSGMTDGDTFYLHDVMFFADEATANKTAKAIANDLNLPDELTLSFVMGDHGSAIPDQIVKKGENPVVPDEPTSDDGYVFDGWYTTKMFGTLFDFDTPLTKEKVFIYAKWVKGFVVSFDCGEGVTAPAAQTVKQNGRAVEPDLPEREGYTFAGWFADSGLTEAFDFGKIIKEDTVIYAKWTEGEAAKYPITVVNGTASLAEAKAGKTVTVTADASELPFLKWVVESESFDDAADLSAAEMTFRMPECAVTLTATYEVPAPVTFTLTVNGEVQTVAAGEAVTLTAEDYEESIFTSWTVVSGNVEIADLTARTITFTMPAEDVVLSKNYQTVFVPVTPGDVDGNGKLNAKDVTAIMKHLVGATPANFNAEAADYDGNGTINAKDVTKLMKYLVANP